MIQKDNYNILIIKKQLIKQLRFKMNARKRTNYPEMINTYVERTTGNGFIVVKLHFLNFIYLAYINYM